VTAVLVACGDEATYDGTTRAHRLSRCFPAGRRSKPTRGSRTARGAAIVENP
jgi:hypothetical protein